MLDQTTAKCQGSVAEGLTNGSKMAAVCAPQADWFFYCSFFLFGRRQTILKVNVAFIFFLLMATFVAVNIVDAYDVWYRRSSPCVAGNSAISFHFGSF